MGVTKDGFPAFFNWPDPAIPKRKSGLVAVVALYRWQTNGCAACGGKFKEQFNSHGTRILHPVDHERYSGRQMVRAILCRSCNLHEAKHGINCKVQVCAWCQLFDEYRRCPPMNVLGLFCNYWEFMKWTGGPKGRSVLEDEFLHV